MGRDGREGGHTVGDRVADLSALEGAGGRQVFVRVSCSIIELDGYSQRDQDGFREPQRAYSWIRTDNAAFGGESAPHLMLDGELADIMRVRRYLEAERADG